MNMRQEHYQMKQELEARGFIIGERDLRRNTAFKGRYMVAEPIDAALLPTEDASRGGWCIVGDSLPDLIQDTYNAVMG